MRLRHRNLKCGLGEKTAEIKLRNVLYVPSLGSNLLSVKKLANDIVLFFKERAVAYSKIRNYKQWHQYLQTSIK